MDVIRTALLEVWVEFGLSADFFFSVKDTIDELTRNTKELVFVDFWPPHRKTYRWTTLSLYHSVRNKYHNF